MWGDEGVRGAKAQAALALVWARIGANPHKDGSVGVEEEDVLVLEVGL